MIAISKAAMLNYLYVSFSYQFVCMFSVITCRANAIISQSFGGNFSVFFWGGAEYYIYVKVEGKPDTEVSGGVQSGKGLSLARRLKGLRERRACRPLRDAGLSAGVNTNLLSS